MQSRSGVTNSGALQPREGDFAMDPKEIGRKIKQQRTKLGIQQDVLADKSGTTQPTIYRIETGDFTRMPSSLPKVARALGMELKDLDPTWDSDSPSAPTRTSSFVNLDGVRDFPVYAAAEGGPGVMLVTAEPIDYIQRPDNVRREAEGFAVHILGDSMEPAFSPGDLAIVNPKLPPRRNRDVILVKGDLTGEFHAAIARLVRWTETDWYVVKFNPTPGMKKDLKYPRKDWRALLVVGKNYG